MSKKGAWLIQLQIQCFEWGMQPRDFWECTLLDIGNYMVGNYNREKAKQEARRMEIYLQARTNAIMQSVNLYNTLSKSNKKAKEYPTFEEIFKDDKKDDKKDNNNSSEIKGKVVYDKITNKNKYEFLHKQKLAYEKMGVKFD